MANRAEQCDLARFAGVAQKAKNPLRKRASRKRLMGLEPTTFCMAISMWIAVFQQ
jgi:hypothetical protein